jgi:hypothetical protein
MFPVAGRYARFAGESAFAKGFNLVDTVKILRDSEAHGVRRSPEHAGKGLDVIVYQSGLVLRVERLVRERFGAVEIWYVRD